MKIAKIAALILAALLVLTLAVATYLAATFDPNEYKPMVIKLVQEKKQRTLTIPGDIKLSFFPNLGADLGQVTLSERNSSETFAAIESAQVSLALMPLLAKQVVVDRVRIDGLRATIRRDRDGSSNVDDLAAPEQEAADGGGEIGFHVAGVEISNANLVYDDRQQERRVEISDLNLKTGKIADGVPGELQIEAAVKSNQPLLDARIAAKTGFTPYLKDKRYMLKGLDAEIKGAFAGMTEATLKAAGDADLKPADKRFALEQITVSMSGKRDGQPFEMRLDLPQLAVTDASVSGAKASGELKLSQGARRIAAAFSVPGFEGSPQAFRLPALEVDATVADADLDLRAKLAGEFSGDIDKLLFTSPQLTLNLTGKQGATPINGSLQTPLMVDLGKQTIELSKLVAEFSLPNPGGGSLTLKAAGQAGLELAREAVTASLNGKLDQSTFNAKLGMTGFGAPAYSFDIGIDRLDLDRYRKPAQASAQKADAPANANAPARPTAGAASGAEPPIDLSALRELRAKGSLRVAALKAGGVNTSNVRVDLRAAGGKLELSPLSANLYGGSANGALTLEASSPPRFALRQNLAGVNVGPLLKDAFDKDTLEGRGDVQLDLTAAGATVDKIKRGLNGTARLALRDGAVRGINVAQTLRGAKSKVDALRGKETAPQTGTGSATEKTDFSELSGSFRITNGVARNDDLDVKSPLIRVAGSGEIDLAGARLDYVARTTVVPTLKGQGGPELQALKGLTIPVRLSGPFDAIDWRVDVAGIATELARQKLDEKKDEIKGKVEEKLKDQLRGLFRK